MDFVVCAQQWPSASFRHVADRSCLYSVGGTGSGIGYAFELGYGYLRRSWATFLRRQEGIGYVSRKVIVMSVIFFFLILGVGFSGGTLFLSNYGRTAICPYNQR